MAAARSEPVSPELVLVCPELAAEARLALPDPDQRPTSLLAGAPAEPEASHEPHEPHEPHAPRWACALAYGATGLAGVLLRGALWAVLLALALTVPLLL